ncbi:glycosyltransferase [Chroococcidiopsis sp. CCMEE 29]|uniref:glycosyltransferase n=1 Tax=Chroococcidiopsis sp. CCMEE 29 TaxID=155894 RepID=UPI00202172B2|nr:glycosyltransferase [Chroococcidiopsis sp. CCMEE 29]
MNDSTRQEQVLSFLFFDLDANGAVKAMLTLARGFIERGFKVDIVVLEAKGEGFKWLPNEARVVELKCRNRGFSKLVYLGSLVQYLRKVQPIALIAGDDINFGSIAKYLARVRTRVVINSQTNLSNLFLKYSPRRVRVSPTAFLLRRFLWFYDWADALVPVSQGVADDLTQIAGRSLKHMRVIHNPVVTPKLFEQAKEPIDREWFKDGAPPVILGVGRLSLQKDFPTLIRAFTIVRKQLPARLMILGEGEERPQIEAMIKELGLASEVALPGFVSNPYAFMSRAAVFVLSSVYEGLPTVLIEAMAVGTPVVSTDCPSGPREILGFGKYGMLVPVRDFEALANAIVTTLSDQTDVEGLRQQAQKFSLENTVNGYLELINPDAA